MKKIIFGIAAAALLVTGSIFVIAQKSGQMGGREFGHRPGHHGGIGRSLRGLDLTAEQKAQVKEIMEASRATAQPLMEQTRSNHEKIRGLGIDGKFDAAQVEALATEQGNLTAKLIVEKGKVKAQIFALLTDEQKAKAETMRTKSGEKFKERKAHSDKPGDFDF